MKAMTTLPEISPERFLFEKCSIYAGISQLQLVTPDFKKFTHLVEPVGYCSAIRLRVRPRTEGFAVMVIWKETGEEVWFHCYELPQLL